MENFSEFSENSGKKSEKLRKVQGDSIILQGTGVQWFCSPTVLFSLKRYEGITAADIVVAFALFEHSASSRYFPTFKITLKNLSKNCFLPERTVYRSIQRLIVLKAISCVSDDQEGNTYTWSEYFLKTGEIHADNLSLGQLTKSQVTTDKKSLDQLTECHRLYIDFFLEFILNLYKEYFSEHQKVFSTYHPQKKTKNVTPQGSGVVITMTRAEAWAKAMSEVAWELSQKGQNGYVRVYLAMVSGKFMACNKFPRPYLLKLAMDSELQWETLKRSDIQFYLDSDESFKNYMNMKLNLIPEEELQ